MDGGWKIYIKNIPLVLEMLRLQREIGREGEGALRLLDRPVIIRETPMDRETIDACANFALRIGGMFGLVNSCLTRSVVRCIMLRRNGVDARVAFGLNKEGRKLEGHCWVVEDTRAETLTDPAGRSYHSVQIFPERQT